MGLLYFQAQKGEYSTTGGSGVYVKMLVIELS